MNKPNYNELIKTARKAKGLTQQELADQAGVSLRTVQRIEKGTEEISGFSLRQISKVLDTPLETLIMENVDNISIDTNQIGSIKTLYLSSLCFIANPILGLIVPLVLSYLKQNKTDFYKAHLKKIIKYHGVIVLIILILFLTIFLKGISNINLLFFVHYIPFVHILIRYVVFIVPSYYICTLIWTLYNFYKLNKIETEKTT